MLQRRLFTLGMVAVVLGCAGSAAAQAKSEAFRLDRYRATPSTQDGFVIDLPDTIPHLHWVAGLSMDYGSNLLVAGRNTTAEQTLVKHRSVAQLGAAFGVLDLLHVYLRAPAVLLSTGSDARLLGASLTAPEGFALGDPSLGVSAQVFELQGLSVGATGEVFVPIGSDDGLAGGAGLEGHVSGTAALQAHELLLLAAQVGADVRGRSQFGYDEVGSTIDVRIGGWVTPPVQGLVVGAELLGAIGLIDRDEPTAADNLELLASLRYKLPDALPVGLHVGAAVGTGFSDAPGEPGFHAILNLAVTGDATSSPPAPEPPAEAEPAEAEPAEAEPAEAAPAPAEAAPAEAAPAEAAPAEAAPAEAAPAPAEAAPAEAAPAPAEAAPAETAPAETAPAEAAPAPAEAAPAPAEAAPAEAAPAAAPAAPADPEGGDSAPAAN